MGNLVSEHQLLERSEQWSALSEAAAEVTSTTRGRMLLIGGESGVGKTALLRAFCAGQARAVWGACDALFTPRPLGPFFEIAEVTGGELASLVAGGAKPHEVAAALLAELGAPKGTVLVLEDLHWADEATLDVVKLLARRVEQAPVLVLASYRDDELERTHPLRIVLGELATSPAVTRVPVERLSQAAVAQLAELHAAIDPEDLFRQTAGNPFFVTEVLAADAEQIPQTVRDAVLARAMRLDPEARTLLEAAAVVTPQADLWLLEALAGDSLDRIEACLASGMLVAVPGGVAFRHELARIAVEESLTPDRALTLHRAALAALADPPAGAPDLARLAHHAEAAGDQPAVLRFAPAAAARASALGAHREAAAQYERALRFADAEPPEAKAELLELCAHECYLSGQVERAVPLAERALAYRRETGDKLREGDSLRALSHLLSFVGRTEEAEVACRNAIELLERLDPSPELAFAYATLAQRRLNWDDVESALEWGTRARDLAQRLDEPATLVHAAITIAAADSRDRSQRGRDRLEDSIRLARGAGLEDQVGRAYLNLAWLCVRQRRLADVGRYLDGGLEYCGDRGLDYWGLCLVACRAWAELSAGRWTEAAESASSVMRDPRQPGVARVFARMVQGLVRARRGDPGASEALDQALALAEPTGEIQQIAPVVAARAEAAWLAGRPDELAAPTTAAYELALQRRVPWEIGELASWCRRLGVEVETPAGAAEPFASQLAGHWEEAARQWAELGCPYEAALALADSGAAEALRQGLERLQELGARPAAAIVARRLRERGARGLPRGPRPATRANRANLTPRELEVLALLTEGLRNVDIAKRLFVAEKTVDHHVSSILRKLDARTRAEASVKAVRLGLAE